MKKQLLLIYLLSAQIFGYSQLFNDCESIIYETPSYCLGHNYFLTIDDHFTGTEINHEYWWVQSRGRIEGEDSKGYYSEESLTFDGEYCYITAEELSSPIQRRLEASCPEHCAPCLTEDDIDNCIMGDGITNLRDFYYKSASIRSKVAYSYGIFEIRCQIPPQSGFWPTFWLHSGSDAENAWNEIDVFDGFNPNTETGLYCASLHGSNSCVKQASRVNLTDPCVYDNWFYNGTDFSDGLHTFTLVWDKYEGIQWYIDTDIFTEENPEPAFSVPAYFDLDGNPLDCDGVIDELAELKTSIPEDPMYLYFELKIPKDPPVDQDFPATFKIDYIKVWQDIDIGCCAPSMRYESTNQLTGMTHTSHFIIAGYDAGVPNVSGDVTVPNNDVVTFKAGDYIDLLPGFTAEAGSVFTAESEECNSNTQPGGYLIYYTNFPSSFSPDGDGVDDKLIVDVYNATRYDIVVTGSTGVFTYYSATAQEITSNHVAVWDGTCNNNCSVYHKCNRNRIVNLTFYNCDHTANYSQEVYVDCSNKSTLFSSNEQSGKTKGNTDKNLQTGGELQDILNISGDIVCSPNPTTGKFNISIQGNTGNPAVIEISDVVGTVISRMETASDRIDADLSAYSKGMYFVKATIGEKQYTKRVVVY
ncbi:MAG: family 16 glycosylhydrolase [Bacteroidetes bacterium]|nr:family 16 glycosylhydrolase [Bacteroidota bacterium]